MSTKKLQILGSLGNKVYVQNEEPTDAPDGAIWVDMDAAGASSVTGGDADTLDGKHASDFAMATDVAAIQKEIDDIQTKVGDTPVIAQITTAIENKADVTHTHSEYAVSDHAHSYNDLSDKPTIPVVPDSLPANGGDADTVDGMHANDFAAADHTHEVATSTADGLMSSADKEKLDTACGDIDSLQTKVGDASVSDQISQAISSIEIPNITYGTADLTAGTSELATGAIYLVYEV